MYSLVRVEELTANVTLGLKTRYAIMVPIRLPIELLTKIYIQ